MDFDPKKYDSLISGSSQRLADLTRGISISVPTTELSSPAKTAISNIVVSKADISGITQALTEICKVHIGDDFRQPIQAMLAAQNEMMSALSSLSAELTRVSLPTIDGALQNLAGAIRSLYDAQSIPPQEADIATEEIADTIEQAIPFVSDEETSSQCAEQVQDLRSGPRSKLTFERAISLLALLIDIFFHLINLLPDKQLDEIIVNQQQARIEEQAEDRAILDTLYAVQDSIIVVSDEVEALRDELEDLNDLPDSQSDPDAPKSQDDDTDPQN